MKYEKIKIENGGWIVIANIGMFQIYIAKTGRDKNEEMENRDENKS